MDTLHLSRDVFCTGQLKGRYCASSSLFQTTVPFAEHPYTIHSFPQALPITMWVKLALMATLAANMAAASLVARDQVSDLTALTTTVKNHTGNISQYSPVHDSTMLTQRLSPRRWHLTLLFHPTDQTLATLPANGDPASFANSTANATIVSEFTLIAQALNSSSDTHTAEDACDATCQLSAYNGMGALSAEIAYTMEGCINKNAVGTSAHPPSPQDLALTEGVLVAATDLMSSTSVLLTVVEAMSDVTDGLEESVTGVAGIVVQNLQAAMGADIGGALATFISPPGKTVS